MHQSNNSNSLSVPLNHENVVIKIEVLEENISQTENDLKPNCDTETYVVSRIEKSKDSDSHITDTNVGEHLKEETEDDERLIAPITANSSAKCIIFHKSTSTSNYYNCVSCSFSTVNVKDAMLHYIFNKSDISPVCLLSYSVKEFVFKCSLCSISFSCDRVALNHWQMHLNNTSLMCFICTYSTNEDSLLKLHLLYHLDQISLLKEEKTDNKEKPVVCIKCNYTSSDRTRLNTHYLQEHGDRRFVCGECPKEMFYYYDDLKLHLNQRHLFSKSIHFNHVHSENDCGSQLVTEAFVDKVETTSVSNEYKCTYCMFSTLIKEHLENHVLEVHDIQTKVVKNSYKCVYCPFSAVLKSYLREHVINVHNVQAKYVTCPLCNKSYLSRGLNNHIKYSHEKNFFQCAHCGYRTIVKSKLIAHFKLHSSKFTQLCYICGYHNSNKVTMNKHILKHISTATFFCDKCDFTSNVKSGVASHVVQFHSTGLTFGCNICDYKGKNKTRLIQHLKCHERKPCSTQHKCSFCNYTTNNKATLRKHLKTHSTTREQFVCKECGKEYKIKRNWLLHELSHKNGKQYNCKICLSAFISKFSLESHIKQQHTSEGRMYCFKCNYSSCHKGNFIEHVNKTCSKAKHKSVNLRQCNHCGFVSNHRSNFTTHVSKCHHKYTVKNSN